MAVKNKTKAEIDAEILANFIKVNNAAKKKTKARRDKNNLNYENANRDFSAQNAKWWRDYEANILANSNPDWDESAVEAQKALDAAALLEAQSETLEAQANIAARSPYDANETFDVMDTLAANRRSNNESGILSSMNMQDMYGASRQQELDEVKSNLATRSPYDAGETSSAMDAINAARQTMLSDDRNRMATSMPITQNDALSFPTPPTPSDLVGGPLDSEDPGFDAMTTSDRLLPRPQLRPVSEEQKRIDALPFMKSELRPTLDSDVSTTGGSSTAGGSSTTGGSSSSGSSGMYESLSKTQKRMMAFAGLRDAGAALQGREGNALNNLMRDFTDRADQRRKAVAASNLQKSNASIFARTLVQTLPHLPVQMVRCQLEKTAK